MRSDKMIAYYTSQGIFGHGLPTSTPSGTSYNLSPDLKDRIEDRKKFCGTAARSLCASFRVSSLAPEEFQEEFKVRQGLYTVIIVYDSTLTPRRFRAQKTLAGFMNNSMDITITDEKTGLQTTKTIKPFRQIPFVPSAYQLDVDRNTIRKNEKLKGEN